MRRACAAALLALAGCAAPIGSERHGCNADWLEVRSVAAQAGAAQEEPLSIECIEQIANRRVRVGFVLPAGPSCHVLGSVKLVESAEAVSITIFSALNDDPNAGACPEEPEMVVTELDLAAPVNDRQLLDGAS